MMIGKNKIKYFKVVVVLKLFLLLLSIDVKISPTSADSLLFMNKWFVQIYFNFNLLSRYIYIYIKVQKLWQMHIVTSNFINKCSPRKIIPQRCSKKLLGN